MGFGSFVRSITSSVSSFVSGTIGGVSSFVRDPFGATQRLLERVDTSLSKAYELGYITIPGTKWQFNLWSFVGGVGVTGVLLGIFPSLVRKKKSNGTQKTAVQLYGAGLKIKVNGVVLEKKAFTALPQQKSPEGIKDFFARNPTYDTYDFCIDTPNSDVSFIFNDTYFQDNSGNLVYKLCYLGTDDECNCQSLEEPSEISIGFTVNDPTLVYPVDAHGMKYVGTNSIGISTGGRSESATIEVAEQELIKKYSTPYSTEINEEKTKQELENARVLDLVYLFNGTAWIRQQDMVESVYYHTGVGDNNNSVFFGGIHNTMTDYKFDYDIDTIPTPEYKDWNCDERTNIDVSSLVLEGTDFSNTLTSSTCWETPTWQVSGSFSPSCPEISAANCNIINDPRYLPNNITNIKFISDKDFPQITISSLAPYTEVKVVPATVTKGLLASLAEKVRG